MDTFHDQLMLDSAVLLKREAAAGGMRMRKPMNWQSADDLQRNWLIIPQGSSVVRVPHVYG